MIKEEQKMPKKKDAITTPKLIIKNEEKILDLWVEYQLSSDKIRSDLFDKGEMKKKGKEFLSMFVEAISEGNVTGIQTEEYEPVIQFLENFSRDTAIRGFTPSETILFVFSLKYALLTMLEKEYSDRHAILANETRVMSSLIDDLGIVTAEAFIDSREEYIKEQVSIIAEMETPVLQVGRGILLVPIIGILDSRRSQAVMDKILQTILATRAKAAIIDITGVATIDTSVSNHILKISKATRLMGCRCVISGVSPDVAQSIVDKGIDMGVLATEADMQDAIEYAFNTRGYEITEKKKGA